MTAISLPIADRQRAHDFYTHGLGLTPIGPPGEDGLPEPLRYDLDGTSILLVPTGGFDWAISDRPLSTPDSVGCLLTIGSATNNDVDDIHRRATDAGATTLLPPTELPWGMYAATFTDPDGNTWMATSTPLPPA